jgi:hypothetical protein
VWRIISRWQLKLKRCALDHNDVWNFMFIISGYTQSNSDVHPPVLRRRSAKQTWGKSDYKSRYFADLEEMKFIFEPTPPKKDKFNFQAAGLSTD